MSTVSLAGRKTELFVMVTGPEGHQVRSIDTHGAQAADAWALTCFKDGGGFHRMAVESALIETELTLLANRWGYVPGRVIGYACESLSQAEALVRQLDRNERAAIGTVDDPAELEAFDEQVAVRPQMGVAG